VTPGVPSCVVCGSEQLTLYKEVSDEEYFSLPGERFAYLECGRCLSIVLPDPPADRLQEIYPPTYYSYKPPSRSPIWRLKSRLDDRTFRKLLARCDGDELSVLDVGGGSGWVLGRLRGIDHRVKRLTVAEFGEHGRAAAEAGGIEYIAGGIDAVPPDAQYDLVLMLSVIEHVADPARELSEVRKRLAPGGLVLVQTPNVDCWERDVMRTRGYWGALHAPRHWVLFSENGFRQTADDAGLRIVEGRHIQGGIFNAWSVMAALHRRGIIKGDAARPVPLHPLTMPIAAALSALDLVRARFTSTSQMLWTLTTDTGDRPPG
jgi:SAM-dependent methyltransferase